MFSLNRNSVKASVDGPNISEKALNSLQAWASLQAELTATEADRSQVPLVPTAVAPAASPSPLQPPLQVTVESLRTGRTDDKNPIVQGRAVEAFSTLLGLPDWPADDKATWAERGVLTTSKPSSSPSLANTPGEESEVEVHSQRALTIRGLVVPQGPCRGSLSFLKPTLHVLASSLCVLELRGNPNINGNLEDLVTHLPLLEHLNLSSCVHVSGNLDAFAESINLQFLNLEGTAVGGSLSALESFGEQLRVLNLKDTWVDVVGERGSLGGLRGLLRLEQLSLGSSQCPVGFRKPRGRQGRASTTASSSSGQQQLSPQPQQQGSALSSSSQSVNGEAASLADADVYDDAFFDAWVHPLSQLPRLAVLDLHCPIPCRRTTAKCLGTALRNLPQKSVRAVYLRSSHVLLARLMAPNGSSGFENAASPHLAASTGKIVDGYVIESNGTGSSSYSSSGGGAGGDFGMNTSTSNGGPTVGGGAGAGNHSVTTPAGSPLDALTHAPLSSTLFRSYKLSKPEGLLRDEQVAVEGCAQLLRQSAGLGPECVVYWVKVW